MFDIGAIFDFGTKVLERVIPDPQKRLDAQIELAKLAQSGELAQLTADTDLAKAQIQVNAVEAQSENVFKSGWRPAAGWVCVSALAYQMLLRPLAGWALVNWLHWTSLPPELDVTSLMTLLFGMLGLGAYRTVEKFKK